MAGAWGSHSRGRCSCVPAAGAGGTVMTLVTTFASTETMDSCLEMGMEDGMSSAVGQIDAMLAG